MKVLAIAVVALATAIDGAELARLMVRHGIGVRTRVLHEL